MKLHIIYYIVRRNECVNLLLVESAAGLQSITFQDAKLKIKNKNSINQLHTCYKQKVSAPTICDHVK